jgi:hypothetical protein
VVVVVVVAFGLNLSIRSLINVIIIGMIETIQAADKPNALSAFLIGWFGFDVFAVE